MKTAARSKYLRLELLRERKKLAEQRRRDEAHEKLHENHFVPRFGCRECYRAAFPPDEGKRDAHIHAGAKEKIEPRESLYGSRQSSSEAQRGQYRKPIFARNENTTRHRASDSTDGKQT